MEDGSAFENRFAIAANQMGLVRLAKSFLLKTVIPGMNYSDEQRKYSEALNLHHTFNPAFCYEDEHMNEICNTAYHAIKPNDVPKVYICSSWGFQSGQEIDEMLAWDKQECEFTGRKQPKFPESGYDMDMLQKLRDTGISRDFFCGFLKLRRWVIYLTISSYLISHLLPREKVRLAPKPVPGKTSGGF